MIRILVLGTLLLTSIHLSFAQMIEPHVDFTVAPGTILSGKIQYAHEWLEPSEFKYKELKAVDVVGVSKMYPDNIKLIAAKIAFVSKKSFDQLAHSKMNDADYITEMMGAMRVRNLENENWRITNKVKAYGLPFRVSFDLKFKEVSPSSLGGAASYLKSEAAAFSGPGRERFSILDMTNFSTLMYRDYSVIYMKEISQNETMIIAGVITGVDIGTANFYFPFGPKNNLLNNLKTQIMNMVRNIQKAD